MVPILLTVQEIREDPTKTSPAERWKYFGQGDHVRLYSRDGFTRRLCEAGFVVHQFGQNYFDAANMTRCGLSASSALYVVEKAGLAARRSSTEAAPQGLWASA